LDISKIVDINKYRRWSGNNYRIEKNDPKESVMYGTFKSADVNDDGNITLPEYLMYLQSKSPQLKITKNVLDVADNIDKLKNAKEEDVRRLAAKVLGEPGNKAAVPPLIHSMRYDKSRKVQIESAEALGMIRGEMAEFALIEDLRGSKDCLMCSGLDKDEDWNVRAGAAWALRGFCEGLAVSALKSAIESDGEYNVRNMAAMSLINIQNNFKPESKFYGEIQKVLDDLRKNGKIL